LLQIDNRGLLPGSPTTGVPDWTVLDRLVDGIVLAEPSGFVLGQNRAALAMIQQGDALMIRDGRIAAIRTSDDERLQDALRRAHTLHAAGLAMPRRSGRRDYLVRIERMPAEDNQLHMVIFDPDAPRNVPAAQLAVFFAMTPSQADVACRLQLGHTPQHIAATTGVTTATVRAHLTQIYRKTRTRNIAELLCLLTALAQTSAHENW
jgi:DNA-binding CsgD family transcriptional regulator